MWAEHNEYTTDDLDNFSSVMYVATALIGNLAGDDLSDESADEIDAIHRAFLEASSIGREDAEFVEPLEQYRPELDTSHPLGWIEGGE